MIRISCLIAMLFASPVFAKDREDPDWFRHQLEAQETQDNLKNIANEVKKLRQQQEWDAPLINGGR